MYIQFLLESFNKKFGNNHLNLLIICWIFLRHIGPYIIVRISISNYNYLVLRWNVGFVILRSLSVSNRKHVMSPKFTLEKFHVLPQLVKILA